jgi:UDP-glucose 4-epimerase
LSGDCSSDKPANLIPIICEVAKGVREKLIVNGDDYNTIDGTCVRDYIHVVDLAKSHVSALKYLLKNLKKDVFNIGTGKGLSVLEAVHFFEKVNKKKINYSIGPRRDGDVEEIYSDNTKVEKLLNWKAEISVEAAMTDAWNWEKMKVK